MPTPPIVLSIAGSDPSGGAGIQADIKTISALGCYAAAAITAVTIQNTRGVQAVHPLPADVVEGQIEAVLDDLAPIAVKIGMVHNAATVSAIARCLARHKPRFVVFDPVMVSSSGRPLLTDDTVAAACELLFPRCTLVTPNLHEAARLLDEAVDTPADMERAAGRLAATYHAAFLVKGGHLDSDTLCDVLCATPPECTAFSAPRIKSHNLHGTGCTLSSAIATHLSLGLPLPEAVRRSKTYISTAISRARDMHIGHGAGPLWHGASK